MSDVSPDGGIKEGCLNLKPRPCIVSVGVEHLHDAGPCDKDCGCSGLRSQKESWAILGGSQKRPQAILSGSHYYHYYHYYDYDYDYYYYYYYYYCYYDNLPNLRVLPVYYLSTRTARSS